MTHTGSGGPVEGLRSSLDKERGGNGGGERGKRAFSSRDDSMRGRGEIKDGVVKASVHPEGSLRHNILTFAK